VARHHYTCLRVWEYSCRSHGVHCRLHPPHICKRGQVSSYIPPRVCEREGGGWELSESQCALLYTPSTHLQAQPGIVVYLPHKHLRVQGWGLGVVGVAVCVVVYTLHAFASAARRCRIFPPHAFVSMRVGAGGCRSHSGRCCIHSPCICECGGCRRRSSQALLYIPPHAFASVRGCQSCMGVAGIVVYPPHTCEHEGVSAA
jgi:hypothetical protein